MHIYDDKVYFSQLSFVRSLNTKRYVLLLCVHVDSKKEGGKEGAKKLGESGRRNK